MTVRGGRFDVIQSIPHGRTLLADSAVLHHVQIPGRPRRLRRFKALRRRLETIDIAIHRGRLMTGRVEPLTPPSLMRYAKLNIRIPM
ncbi:hypothetical protein [Desulfosarcina sp.]|uniref:hypothetical protein n=1 Tax=Desulfosarcina sp. TaxID=2027861 RepID=UPI0035667B8C